MLVNSRQGYFYAFSHATGSVEREQPFLEKDMGWGWLNLNPGSRRGRRGKVYKNLVGV